MDVKATAVQNGGAIADQFYNNFQLILLHEKTIFNFRELALKVLF
jgi:hypothetical protein